MMTVDAGLTARIVCWIETERSETDMFVKAKSSVTNKVTNANPHPFALQSSTPQVDGFIRKTGISMRQVTMQDIADSATGVEAELSSSLVSKVFVTATAM